VSELMLGSALGAVVEWDLTDGGVPVPCDEAAKVRLAPFLRMLMAQRIVGGGFLATEIVEKANDPENFSGN